jgi:hypothetical protein
MLDGPRPFSAGARGTEGLRSVFSNSLCERGRIANAGDKPPADTAKASIIAVTSREVALRDGPHFSPVTDVTGSWGETFTDRSVFSIDFFRRMMRNRD